MARAHPLTGVRQRIVKASPEYCWQSVTLPASVSEWFADTLTIQLGEAVTFDFGDGDFLPAGSPIRAAPRAGPRLAVPGRRSGYDIAYALTPPHEGTEVLVTDRGAGSAAEADPLSEGWDDIPQRLARRGETGEACPYRWSECIGASCFAERSPALVGGWRVS